jgi:hypothetical protein
MVNGTSTKRGQITRIDAEAPSSRAISDAGIRTLARRPVVRVALFEDLSRFEGASSGDPARATEVAGGG